MSGRSLYSGLRRPYVIRMAQPTWRWTCDDDEEALGVATILGRHGVVLRREDRGPTEIVLTAVGDDAGRAAALEHRLADKVAARLDAGLASDLDRREGRGRRALALALVGLAVVGVLVLVLGP